MRADVVLAMARAEARQMVRLARYWVFLVLAALLGLAVYFFCAALHGFASHYSASMGAFNPRYVVGATAFYYLMVFVVGLIMLGFDVRARDQRERIVEVLDSQPCTNPELLLGRFLGIMVPAWLPALGVAVVMQLFGWIARRAGWPLGEPIEPWSVLSFLVLMAIPTFAFVLALVFLLSLLIKHRFLTAIVALVVIVGVTWAAMVLPLHWGWVADLTGGFSFSPPSDLVPTFATPLGLGQRLALLIAAGGLLALAAAVHPRRDGGSRQLRATTGAVLLGAAVALVATMAVGHQARLSRFADWRAAHEARRDDPIVDLETISGRLGIDPGRALRLELELGLAAPPEGALTRALFTLNPGLKVEGITDGGGAELAWEHQEGLLDVELPYLLPAGSKTTLTMTIEGRPETAFAYLDAVIDPLSRPATQANVAVLGFEPAIFDRRYVVLMPGIHWLPTPGVDVGRSDPARRPVDFFHLDLTVELPAGWLAAGPGRRQEAEGAGAERIAFRFAPAAPLPEAAIVASRFASRRLEVEEVELEVLVHPAHTRNLEVLAEAGGEIREWLGERLREAAELGLPYPYGALTLVECPSALRGFGGGWQMASTMAPPAVVLMRENSFPTARFDVPFRDPEDFADREGGIARAKRESLERFFVNDFFGANPFLGAARNFFPYQTAATGAGGLALDLVLGDLTNRLITDQEGFFSAHVFGEQMQPVMQTTIGNVASGRQDSVARAVFDAATDRPENWERALEIPLSELDPWEDPQRSLDVLKLKSDAMSRSLLDGLGRRQAGALLAALRRRAAGRNYDRSDLQQAAAEVGVDLAGLVDDWLDTTALAGFVASPARLVRLADTADGVPQYQLALHVRNDEPAPGVLRLAYMPGGEATGRNPEPERTDPTRVGAGEAVEIGVVLARPPRGAWIEPYLALNRHPFQIRLPELDEEKIVADEPLRGSRPSDWAPPPSDAIVVDDLDPGFRIDTGDQRSGLRLGARGLPQSYDQGLPVPMPEFRPPPVWSRRVIGPAYGKYRHTLAAIARGRGNHLAVFTAELPRAGRWRLELYMVPASGPGRGGRNPWRRGTYHLAVVEAGGNREEITFDAAGSEPEWNLLAELELPAGVTRVELSNKTDGRAVLADAIRWLPVGGGAKEAEPVAEEQVGESAG